MRSKYSGYLITLFLIYAIGFKTCFASRLELINHADFDTAYTKIKTKEYKIPGINNLKGSISMLSSYEISLMSEDGRLYKANLRSLDVAEFQLPKIDFGIESIKKSKKITYRELNPGIHSHLYSDTGALYITYDKYDLEQDSISLNVAVLDKNQKQWRLLYSSPSLDVPYYAKGVGGRMLIDGTRLYFTVGDYSLDRYNKLPSDIAAQNKQLPFGKINYIDLKNNTFHMFSMGHRVPLGLMKNDRNEIISTENGPQGGDEINVINEGQNYGWPFASFGTKYGSFNKYNYGLEIPKNFRYKLPLYSFVPSVAPSQIIQVRNIHNDWDKDYFMASLKAQTLYHLKIRDSRVIFCEPIFLGRRLRDLLQIKNNLYLLTDDFTIIKVGVYYDSH